MILKELYLYPDLVEYSDEIVHPFRDQSRSICNYLERELKLVKFDANGFKRICFIGKSVPSKDCYINSSKVLIVEFKFDEKNYLSLDNSELNDFFRELLELGITKCERQYSIPSHELRESLAKFKEGGFLNEWCYKSKMIKEIGIKCSLECRLTITDFHLNLVIEKENSIIWQKEILRTAPDEVVYIPMFKDVTLRNGSLVVLDKFGDSIYELYVKDLELNL
ncbi:hypothetical protein [Vibrio spartinae]|uniref:Uncharacterized protein n=1 Tax=Vibrio spartinae TaxID=1918945 RepID=A0A1N6M068_9VIBR|nr:hypothetical protein [Vibrio spartinae]SIO92802.1 hypothetical protein VSP9026_00423 [Vibrio spartinae]